MTPIRKPRSDAVLLNLPPAQQAQLTNWLLSGLSYRHVQARLRQQFSIPVSLPVVAGYWRRVCLPLLARQPHAQSLAASPQDVEALDGAADAAISQRTFELCLTPAANLADLQALCRLRLRQKALQLHQARLLLAQQKLTLRPPPVKPC